VQTAVPIAMTGSTLTPIVRWLDEQVLSSIYSSQYWNDLAAEQSKEWWIADGSEASFARLQSHLEETGLMDGYRFAERFVAQIPAQELSVLDLAAGIGWTSSLLSRLPNVASVDAVELSQHRLELLFPQAVRMFKGEAAKLRRNLGSFYELSFRDASMDVVVISSAFHHAASPLRLLMEIDRVLKPGGKLILIGENFVGAVQITRRMLKKLVTDKRLCWNFYELFPPDDVSGDHYYRVSDYYMFLQMLGYRLAEFEVQKKQLAAFAAEKRAN
jgi:ubiquinone/menaquinone biosynthesis C-methylase UbiE